MGWVNGSLKEELWRLWSPENNYEIRTAEGGILTCLINEAVDSALWRVTGIPDLEENQGQSSGEDGAQIKGRTTPVLTWVSRGELVTFLKL